MTQVRPADASEIDRVARLWHDVWHESHGDLSPPALTRLRTLENFQDRLRAGMPDIYVVGPMGAPLGFCALRPDELYQLFVSPSAHGKGVAAALIADAEMRLAARGTTTAFLTCAIGNERAARFYEKSGWRRTGIIELAAETSQGPFPVKNWRYEKRLTPSS